jgi:putative DNA primase/helicase
MPQASQVVFEQIKDLSSPIAHFVRENCEVGGDFVVPCDSLYAAYKAWCLQNGQEHVMTDGRFGRALHAAFPGVERRRIPNHLLRNDRRPRGYFGIRLLDPAELRAA